DAELVKDPVEDRVIRLVSCDRGPRSQDDEYAALAEKYGVVFDDDEDDVDDDIDDASNESDDDADE
ncbi:MAG: hypothetical protein EB037_06285, partial [Actinobacteria bacterium]|nr:hypothetical protein [Actinomycetota bacterium]